MISQGEQEPTTTTTPNGQVIDRLTILDDLTEWPLNTD